MLEEKLKTKLKLSKKRGAEKSVEGSGVARKKSGKKKHAVEASESAAVDSAETAKKSKIWRTTCTTSVQSYVNDLAWGGQHSIAAALGSGAVNLYEAQPAELRLVQANKYHAGQASQLKFQPESPRVLYSCGGDGAVVAWDGRSNQVVQRMVAKGAFLNTIDVSQSLVAAGTNGSVLFWDVRTATASGDGAVLANFEDTHEQQVTRVSFHGERQKFLSASEDGLIAVFDFANCVDEDDSFQGAVNLMDSVADFGFFGPSKDLLWCRTFTESFYTWAWAAACDEDSQGGEGPSAAVRDAREQLSAVVKKRLPKGIEYLVGCSYSSDTDKLSLSAGTAEGDVAIFPVSLANGSCSFKKPTAILSGAHTAVVRSQVWPQDGAFVTFTGSEDGKIAAWKTPVL